MADPVTDALARIAERGGGSFAIVTDRARANLFAQFVADDAGLYCELVGNAYLPPMERLGERQQADLRARGWADGGEENWSRTWADVATEDARRAIAGEALGALRDVYGGSGNVEVEEHLEDADPPSTELVTGRARLALLAGVALGLLAFVGAILASLF